MDYLKLAQTVAAAAAAGSYDAEAYLSIGTSTQVGVDRQAVEQLSYSGSKGLGVRVLRDGQMGYAYTSDFSDDSVRATVAAAQALTEAADADTFRTLPEPEPLPDEELAIYDPTIAATHIDDKVQFALAVERATLDYDARVVMTNRCTYFDETGTVYLANSRGFAGSYARSFVGSYVIAIGRDGAEQTQAFGLKGATSLAELDAEVIGRMAGRRAVSLLGGRPVPSQNVTVVFDPIVTAQLLGALSQALNAQAMQRGRSFLADKMGSDVANERVSILDNGRLPGGLGTRPFDDEGVPTRATRLIDEGVLRALIYDTYAANKAGTRSTGNATRGSHRTPPGVGPANFYLQPGTQSPEEIIAGVETGLYVMNAMNTGGINPVAGHYSSAASGLWIENGRLTHAVNEVTIAASLPDILYGITAIGNDLTFVPFFGAIGAPTIRIDTMTVGGR